MIKKIIILLFISISFVNVSFANLNGYDPFWNNVEDNSNSKENFVESQEVKDERQREADRQREEDLNKKNLENNWVPYDTQENIDKRLDQAAAEKAKADREKECTWSWNCLDQPTFTIWIKDTIWIGFETKWTTSQTINYTLGTIIQKLMIALWVLAVLIMTVWAGYIIMYHGQDELLSKGKSIFMSGITSLVVALSSYYLVSILRYILYK